MLKQRGFTFLELVFILLLGSILSCLAFSSFAPLKQKNEQHRLVNELKNALRYARIKALSEGHDLMLSPIKANDWSSGINLFDLSIHDQKNTLLHQWDWHTGNWILDWQGVNGADSLVISGSTRALNNGRFILEHRFSHKKITLIVNRLGRVREL